MKSDRKMTNTFKSKLKGFYRQDSITTGNHSEIIEKHGSKQAIVFIHGILGSPGQFLPIIERVSLCGIDSIALLLPGHGGAAKDFNRKTCHEWKPYAMERISELRCEYDDLTLMGHSMGGLFCIDYAADHTLTPPDRIILLNTPMHAKVSKGQLGISRKVLFTPPDMDDELTSTYRRAFSIISGRIVDYPTWVYPFAYLLRLVGRTRAHIREVNVPALILQSCRDESVHCESGMLLEQSFSGARHLRRLKTSTHSHFSDEDMNMMLDEITKFLNV